MTPTKGKTLFLYVAVSEGVISIVLVCQRKQEPSPYTITPKGCKDLKQDTSMIFTLVVIESNLSRRVLALRVFHFDNIKLIWNMIFNVKYENNFEN